MKLVETNLEGVLVLEIEPISDERGFFARTWDREALGSRRLATSVFQVSTAVNNAAGTLRGLHYQESPHVEAKTVRCTAGRIFDVAVDLRTESPTYLRWAGVELSATNRRGLYIPEGCAHGYITLVDDTEVQYLISAPYHPEAARGYRWDDPTLAIDWPIPVQRISARDSELPFVKGLGPT